MYDTNVMFLDQVNDVVSSASLVNTDCIFLLSFGRKKDFFPDQKTKEKISLH